MRKAQAGKRSGFKFLNILAILVIVLLVLILVVNLTIIVKSFAEPDQVPGFFGYKPLIVLSGSMEPTILPGDLIIVKEVKPDTLQEGDIISYKKDVSVTTHRITEIVDLEGNREFFTKGDNNNVEDGVAITEDMLEGQYLFRIPGLGNAAMFMQKPAGIIIFIAIPLILFIIYDILRRRHYHKKELAINMKLEEELEEMKKKLAEAEAKKIIDGESSPDKEE